MKLKEFKVVYDLPALSRYPDYCGPCVSYVEARDEDQAESIIEARYSNRFGQEPAILAVEENKT